MFQHVVRTTTLWQAGGGSTLNLPPLPTDNMHANATLTPLMRAKMVHHHASGASLRTTAAAFGVSEKTVRKWLKRAQHISNAKRWRRLGAAACSVPRS
jgi:Homeodomain-like domain